MNEKPCDQKRITKFPKGILKGKVFGFAQIDIEVPTSFMTSLVRWLHCLLFKIYLIVIYLKKCIRKKLAEKQSRKQKSYWLLKRQKRSFCTRS